MAKSSWAAFPHPDKAFDYAGDKLAKAWSKLHAGDQEPFPDDKHVARLLKANPSLDQTKATWASMGADKAALGQACKAASDAFAAQATAMKC